MVAMNDRYVNVFQVWDWFFDVHRRVGLNVDRHRSIDGHSHGIRHLRQRKRKRINICGRCCLIGQATLTSFSTGMWWNRSTGYGAGTGTSTLIGTGRSTCREPIFLNYYLCSRCFIHHSNQILTLTGTGRSIGICTGTGTSFAWDRTNSLNHYSTLQRNSNLTAAVIEHLPL